VKLLLEHGADPTVKGKYGETPLDLTREHDVVLVIEEWLGRGKKRRGKKPPLKR